jgi:two-component system, NarL family, sensor histidine kinase UhpB
MYLRTRLLLGIAIVTLLALAISAVVPLTSIRDEVAIETESSTQIAVLLLAIENSIDDAPDLAAARAGAAEKIRRSEPLRHIKIDLLDPTGKVLAVSPTDEPQGGRLAIMLLPKETNVTLRYELEYHGESLGQLRLLSNPLSEVTEIERNTFRTLELLALTIVAMAVSIYLIVRRSLLPVGQIHVALTRLEGGDLEVRLPRFRLKDLDDISKRFNHCAAAMQEVAAQRRELTRRLIDVEEGERKRLARELHDELGQSLTAIKVDAAYIAREAAGVSTRIVACARGVEKVASDIMEIIRGMLARLRPHGLETMGLRDTLQELVNGWQTRVAGRFQCTLRFSGPVNGLPPDLNITVYRLIQECLTNAVRHSRARVIDIDLTVETGEAGARGEVPQRVELSVQESRLTPGEPHAVASGSGVLGMRERVQSHGGELRVDIGQSGGMSLHAWMPVMWRTEEAVHA